MTKKENHPGRAIHHIDLSLPIVSADTYEIFCTIPSSKSSRTRFHPPSQTLNQTIKPRSPVRFKHLLGPPLVNLFVDTNTMTVETISTITETVSNPSRNLRYHHRILKSLPTTMNKSNKSKTIKDDGDQSHSSAGDRFLYDSFASFDDQNKYKSKNNTMWQNNHHPQLTATKTLHTRGSSKRSLNSIDTNLKISAATSFDNLSQESTASIHERLHERIEQITKSYFPSIQQIRHARPSPELINNRMHLHRVEEKNFMPILLRTRAVR
ncbi:hypothetical protein I4U23_025253 [Adineta vaga]|nr:hypothetical protein I4U23_025253 [Adineta vaga]